MTQSLKTRIVYLNHTGKVSGAERVLINMLRGLDRSRYEPIVLCPAEGDLAALVRAEDVTCSPVPAIEARFAMRPGAMIRAVASAARSTLRLRKEILRLDPKIVHANTVRAGLAATLATVGTRRKVIWHLHDTLPHHGVSTVIRALAWVSSRTMHIAISRAVAKAFCGHFPISRRVHTIHNGIDLSKFPLRKPGASGFRQSLGISDDSFLVCTIGQICARKGLVELVEAFGQVADGAHAHLVLVGTVVFKHEAAYYEKLLASLQQSPAAARIHFVGERNDIPQILQAANLLVLNSHDEPFGLVLIEAMSCGTPVLATRVGGVPEIITNGKNGWLVEDGDTAGLATKLLELSNDRERLAAIARVAHQETCPRFSVERFQSNLHKLYDDIAPRAPSPRAPRNHPALVRGIED